MNESMSDDLCSEFYEYYNNSKVRINGTIKPQIVLHYNVIEKLLKDGNSLKSIYNFLLVKNIIKCSYGYFLRMYYDVKESK